MEIRFKGTLQEFRAIFGKSVPVSGSDPVPMTEVQQPEPPSAAPTVADVVQGEEGHYWNDQLPPMPEDDDPYMDRPPSLLPTISDDLRSKAWAAFVQMVKEWTHNFGQSDAVQPNRLALMQELGHGQFTIPVVIMAYEAKSLQRLIEKALKEAGLNSDLDYADQIACNMVQVSHMGFPDLAGTYDYSTSWKRKNPWT